MPRTKSARDSVTDMRVSGFTPPSRAKDERDSDGLDRSMHQQRIVTAKVTGYGILNVRPQLIHGFDLSENVMAEGAVLF